MDKPRELSVVVTVLWPCNVYKAIHFASARVNVLGMDAPLTCPFQTGLLSAVVLHLVNNTNCCTSAICKPVLFHVLVLNFRFHPRQQIAYCSYGKPVL